MVLRKDEIPEGERTVVRRKEEIRVRNVEHAQGGSGTVTFHDFLLPEDAAGSSASLSSRRARRLASTRTRENLKRFT